MRVKAHKKGVLTIAWDISFYASYVNFFFDYTQYEIFIKRILIVFFAHSLSYIPKTIEFAKRSVI